MAFDKMRSAGYLVNHMARLFALGLAARIKPLGLVPGQFPALLALWDEDGLSQKELVRRLDVEQATMANTLARMERDGLVRRVRDPGDARAQQIWLTPRARALRESAIAAATAENASALAGLSKAEQRQFVDLMGRVLETLRARDGSG